MPQAEYYSGYSPGEAIQGEAFGKRKRLLAEKAYILLAGIKGGFLYDKELGSNIRAMLKTACDAGALEAQARKALAMLPELEVREVSLENRNLAVIMNSDEGEFVLNIQGG